MKTATNSVASLASAATKKAERLNRIVKAQAEIAKQREKLDAREQKLIAEATEVSAGRPPKARKMRKTKVKAAAKTAKPAKAKKPAKTKAAKRGRATSKTGETLPQILLRVLPGFEEEAINKDAIAALVTKAGYKSASGDPKVVIGQALGKSNMFKAASRGLWHRSKAGDKAVAVPAEVTK